MVNLQAGKLRGTVGTSSPSRNRKANRHGMAGRRTGRPGRESSGEEDDPGAAGGDCSEGVSGKVASVGCPGWRSTLSEPAATTRAVKARLLDDADHYDELAAKADGAGADAEKP